MAGVTGAVVIVQPRFQGHSEVSKQRIPCTPIYALNTSDSSHWFWEAIPGSEAGPHEFVLGSMHHVAMRVGYAPSDPTIEQFDPEDAPKLYLVQ